MYLLYRILSALFYISPLVDSVLHVLSIIFFSCCQFRFGNTAYLHISVAFIQMLKALSMWKQSALFNYIVRNHCLILMTGYFCFNVAVPVATFFMGVMCGTDKPRCDVFLNMVLVSVGVVISSYGEIHFNIVGTVYQVTGIFAEALRLVLTQVLLQKKGLTLNPITSLYYIAPCRYTNYMSPILLFLHF